MKSEKLKLKNKKLKLKNTLHFSLNTFYFIPCFILVGGKSSRFGSEKDDKAALFYELQFNKCKKIFKNVYFVAKIKNLKNIRSL